MRAPGTWYLVQGTWYQVLGIRHLVPGNWHLITKTIFDFIYREWDDLFGKTETEIMELHKYGYNPDQFIKQSAELQEVLRLIEVGHFSNGDTELFRPLLNSLTGDDPFFVMADFADYIRAQDNVRIDVGGATDGRFFHDGTDTL